MSCRHKDGNNSSRYICFDASSKLPDLKLMFSFQKETVVFIANQPRPSSKVEAICGRVGKAQSRLHVFRHRDVDLPHCLTNCNMLRISGVGETGGYYLLSQLANLFCVWCSFDNLIDTEISQICCAQTQGMTASGWSERNKGNTMPQLAFLEDIFARFSARKLMVLNGQEGKVKKVNGYNPHTDRWCIRWKFPL